MVLGMCASWQPGSGGKGGGREKKKEGEREREIERVQISSFPFYFILDPSLWDGAATFRAGLPHLVNSLWKHLNMLY
jgi:hypothetical protein